MSDTCVPSVIVIDIAINQLETKASLKTMLPEAIGCCLQTSTYCCFYQGSEILCIYTFVHKTSKLLSYMDTCIAITMYCQRLFLMFT